MNKIPVIVANYNGREIIEESLRSIFNQDIDLKVILVDDNSDDNSINFIKNKFDDRMNNGSLVLIENNQTLGVAKTFNKGIAYAIKHLNPEYIIKQDNDLILEKGALRAFIEVADSDRNIGIMGGKIYIFGEDRRIQQIGQKIYYFLGLPLFKTIGARAKDDGKFDTEMEVDIVSGALMLFRSTLFDKVGYFSEDFDKYGFEDFEYSLRSKRKGFKVLYNPRAVGYHKISHSDRNSTYNRAYYRAHNRILMIKKSFGWGAFFFYSVILFMYLFYDWLVRKRNFFSILKGHIAGVFKVFKVR